MNRKNIDNLIEMDVEKLRDYYKQPINTMKRALNKKSKEIIAQFENLGTLEKTQLLSITLLKDELKEPLKLLGVDASLKRTKMSNIQKNIVESVKDGLHSIGKTTRCADKSISRRVILTSILNKNMSQKRQISSLSSHIRYSRKTLGHYLKRRINLDDTTLEGNWALMCRVLRSDRINETVRNLVTTFWTDHTRPSPNTRDVIKKRIGPKEYLQHTKHWLDNTQHELYLSFCN